MTATEKTWLLDSIPAVSLAEGVVLRSKVNPTRVCVVVHVYPANDPKGRYVAVGFGPTMIDSNPHIEQISHDDMRDNWRADLWSLQGFGYALRQLMAAGWEPYIADGMEWMQIRHRELYGTTTDADRIALACAMAKGAP